MDLPVLAHWIGAVGELLNLVGAAVIAYDLIGRNQEHRYQKKLNDAHEFATKYGLESATYRDVKMVDSDFVKNLLNSRSSKLGYGGLTILLLGFLLLIVYHGIEIYVDS